jgi:hypothetical protein
MPQLTCSARRSLTPLKPREKRLSMVLSSALSSGRIWYASCSADDASSACDSFTTFSLSTNGSTATGIACDAMT